MDLDTFKAILAGERADDLSPVEADAFEHLLRTSQAARDALAAAEDELAPLANRFDPIEPTPQQWGRVDAAIREEAARSVGRSRFRALPVWVAAAAAALLVVTIGFSVPTELFRPSNGSLSGVGVTDPNKPPAPKPTVPIKPTPISGGTNAPAAEPVPTASVIGGEDGLKFDPNVFEASWTESDGLLCVWVRDKRL